MNHATLNAIADFGDVAALLPATVAIALALVFARRSRDGLAWMGTVASCMVATFVLKAACADGFDVGGEHLETLGFPSGHAAMAVSFYGTLTVLLWRMSGHSRFTAFFCAIPLVIGALVIGAVWQLKWHTPSDLVGGAALGTIAMAILAWPGGRAIPSTNATLTVAVTAMVAIVSLHGARLEYRPNESVLILRGFPFLSKSILVKSAGNYRHYVARSN